MEKDTIKKLNNFMIVAWIIIFAIDLFFVINSPDVWGGVFVGFAFGMLLYTLAQRAQFIRELRLRESIYKLFKLLDEILLTTKSKQEEKK